MKDISKVDRPQEKLAKYGVGKLSDAEILAVILRSGTKDCNVIELSKKILRKFKNNIDEINIDSLKGIKGLGEIKACQIIASIELAKRLESKPKNRLMSAEEVFESAKDIRDNKKEYLIAIYLDTKNREITRETISIGTLNANLIHPREVFEPAVRNLAAGIIIVHNHPSGDTTPSPDDLDITSQLVEAGRIMGILITDHLIVSSKMYYSFNEHGLIRNV